MKVRNKRTKRNLLFLLVSLSEICLPAIAKEANATRGCPPDAAIFRTLFRGDREQRCSAISVSWALFRLIRLFRQRLPPAAEFGQQNEKKNRPPTPWLCLQAGPSEVAKSIDDAIVLLKCAEDKLWLTVPAEEFMTPKELAEFGRG